MNTAIETVRRDHFVHDDLTINVLRPLIGMSQGHIRELEVYQPQTLQVSNIHQEYIEGWRAQQFAIAAAVDAAERGDYVQLSSANNDLLQAQQAVMTTNANLQQLADKAGLLTPGPGRADAGRAANIRRRLDRIRLARRLARSHHRHARGSLIHTLRTEPLSSPFQEWH